MSCEIYEGRDWDAVLRRQRWFLKFYIGAIIVWLAVLGYNTYNLYQQEVTRDALVMRVDAMKKACDAR